MNGQRDRGEHPAVPMTPQEIAASAAAAVAAGATDLHVHAKADAGRDTLVLPDGNRATDNAELVTAALGYHNLARGVATG